MARPAKTMSATSGPKSIAGWWSSASRHASEGPRASGLGVVVFVPAVVLALVPPLVKVQTGNAVSVYERTMRTIPQVKAESVASTRTPTERYSMPRVSAAWVAFSSTVKNRNR